jgi:HAD superfamily hydrolase (TIGR01549 family)
VTPRASDLDAVTFDAMGTLLRLVDPAPRLQAALEQHLGLVVSLERAERAMRAEIAHYRANCHRAVDEAALATVRLECCGVIADTLAGVEAADILPCLTDAIVYISYPDAAATLRALRASGLRIAVVSNWDVSLAAALHGTGLAAAVDVVVTSAEAGAEKPAAAIFERALEALDARPHRVLHVGDDPIADVDGARAAHLHAVLLARDGRPAMRKPRIATLLEVPALLDVADD